MKIEFEDRGQDLLWLELDPANGLIMNCGPYHSDIYADGDHWVELESIGLGKQPFCYVGEEDRAKKVGTFFAYKAVALAYIEAA